MNDRKLLVIDDNTAVSTALELLFSLEGWQTISATTPEDGLSALKNESVDLVIQDMNFKADKTSGEEGIELFHTIREQYPDLPIILLTAWTSLETAVDLVRGGAADYLAKPWDDKKLITTIRNLLELSDSTQELLRLKERNNQTRSALFKEYTLNNIIFQDPLTENLIRLACQVAKSDIPILITGPNGAGKEKIAELIHDNSVNPNNNFVAVNCGALPKELIEAELFGAEAGAYTGANKIRIGRFEAADGGTLFLDEIGNLPLEGQMKLLRVLETQQFERLGSTKTKTVNVRVISATNADLPAMIEAGEFREDLYYRLNVIELKLPPLADRPEDILPLANFFLDGEKQLSSDAQQALLNHPWPGNVRELRNAIKRAQLLCSNNKVEIEHLGLRAFNEANSSANVMESGVTESSIAESNVTESSATESHTPPKPKVKKEPTKDEIEAALAETHGVIANAAQKLGLSRQSLYRRMERFDIKKK
ncbi:sigma-54-dependent transcriptional regulator [Sessilibacter corallicola]|uniref:Sigma-54 dependent transcriptional regulator n=1 Tax=Sessilibacter corallicola TaxID=2904075 RepID=A0ABQ0A9N8_9GAMM